MWQILPFSLSDAAVPPPSVATQLGITPEQFQAILIGVVVVFALFTTFKWLYFLRKIRSMRPGEKK